MLQVEAKVNQYKKDQNTNIFVYSIISNAVDAAAKKKELEEYKESQGQYYREDEETKKPLYFSQRVISTESTLRKTASGRYTVLSDLEEEAKQAEYEQNKQIAKLKALQSFTGMSKAELIDRMFAN